MKLVVLGLGLLVGCGRIGFESDVRAHSELVLDRFDAGEVLTDVPILLLLDDSRIDPAIAAPSGSDLRVYDAAGTNLPIELERASNPFVAWVRVPRIEGTTTTLTLRYGDIGAPRAIGPVWDASFAAVWHFGDDVRDATGNGHDGVPENSTAVGGYRGGGWDFTHGVIRIPDSPSLALSQFTISGVMLIRSMPEQYGAMIAREDHATAGNDMYIGARDYLGAVRLSTAVQIDTGYVGLESTAMSTGEWHHLALTYDMVNVRGYVDAMLAVEVPRAGNAGYSPGNPIFLGADRNNLDGTGQTAMPDTDFLDGRIDEVRIERVARSPAWIAATYHAIGDSWITYGPIEYD